MKEEGSESQAGGRSGAEGAGKPFTVSYGTN